MPDVAVYREIPEIQIVRRGDDSSTARFEVEDSANVRLARNGHGYTTLHLASARNLQSVTNIVENHTVSDAVVLLSDKTLIEGWTSLHISTISNNAEVVRYVLDKIADNEQRRMFIDQVDSQLGWTSLQWGAALDSVDSVEATMSRMSLDHQKELMTSSWTLLHATAKTGAAKTMKSLMQKFQANKEERWKVLKCRTAQGQTALHIAVAEGNARVAIMLLDFAEERQSQLLDEKDSRGNKAEAYTNDYTTLAAILSPAEFDYPTLHLAALRDDKYLLSWILETCSDDGAAQIGHKNCDGQTVLHLASTVNSSNVIKQLSKELSADDFLTSAMEFSEDGQAAIHLAVVKNNPSSVHALLEAANDEGRQRLLSTKNQLGKTALELAEQNHGDECWNILQCK